MASFRLLPLLLIIPAVTSQDLEDSSNKGSTCNWHLFVSAKSLISERCIRICRRPCHCSASFSCKFTDFELKTEKWPWGYRCSKVITWCPWEAWTYHSKPSNTNNRLRCIHSSMRRRQCCVETWNGLFKTRQDDPLIKCEGKAKESRLRQQRCPGTTTDRSGSAPPPADLRFSSFAIVSGVVVAATLGAWTLFLCRANIHVLCRRHADGLAMPAGDSVDLPPPSYAEVEAEMLTPPTYEEAMKGIGIRMVERVAVPLCEGVTSSSM